MINVLRALMGKIDSMQEQMCSVSREMDVLRKDQREMLEIKNSVTEMKNASDGLAGRLNMAEERISELEDILIQFSKTKNQREQRLKKKKAEQVIQGLWDNHNRCDIHSMGPPEGKEREKAEKIFEKIMTENFPQINVRYQTTNPGSLENTKQDKDKCKNKKQNKTKQKTPQNYT